MRSLIAFMSEVSLHGFPYYNASFRHNVLPTCGAYFEVYPRLGISARAQQGTGVWFYLRD